MQGQATERQQCKAAAESKVIPEVPPMNIHVHVLMHQDVAVGHDFAVDGRGMLGLTAYLDRALNDIGIDVADAAMAGAVHHGGSGR